MRNGDFSGALESTRRKFMRLLALLAGVTLVVAAVGCSESAEKPKPVKPVKILVITRAGTADVTAGAKATAATLKDVTVEFREPKTSSEQATALHFEAAAKDVQGVAIDCAAADNEVCQAIAACAKAGLPVVTFNEDCPDSGRHSFVGENPALAGRLMAGELVQQMSAKGSGAGLVAIISAEGPQYKAMEDGALSLLKTARDVSVMEPVRVAENPADVTAAINDLVGKEKNLRGWIILNPAALPNKEAAPLEKLKGAAVVALAPNDDLFDVVTPEKVSVLFVPQYIPMGSAVVQMLVGIVRDRQQYPDVIHMGPVAVTMADIDTAKKRLEKIKSGAAVTEIFAGGTGKPVPTAGAAVPAAEEKKPVEVKPTETKPVEAPAAEEKKPAEAAPAITPSSETK